MSDTIVEAMDKAIRISLLEPDPETYLYVERLKNEGVRAYIQLGSTFLGMDLGPYAAEALGRWLLRAVDAQPAVQP